MLLTLFYDPIPWLLAQTGDAAVCARRALQLDLSGDVERTGMIIERYAAAQLDDGSIASSPLQTAGVMKRCVDLQCPASQPLLARASEYLFGVLMHQPGYACAHAVSPGSLREACNLGGFFGPYAERNQPDVLARGAREMHAYREFEPLLGPKTPVPSARRSTRDRGGPGSCYTWGLIPLCQIIEALCRAGYAEDARLTPALNVLLGAQRDSGGWCRNMGGHAHCTAPALRALGAHPQWRCSGYADKAIMRFRATWRQHRINIFAALHAVTPFDASFAAGMISDILADVHPRQHRDGTFGMPCRIERVTAVLLAMHTISTGHHG